MRRVRLDHDSDRRQRSRRDSPAARRRGVAMVLVMLAVAVGMILVLSFVGVQSTSLGVSRNIQEHPKARFIAESGMALAAEYVRTEPDWRSLQSEGVWVADHPFAGGSFTVRGEDGDISGGDGDLSDDPADPLTLTVTGAYQGVTAESRLELHPTPIMGRLLAVVDDADSLRLEEAVLLDAFREWGWLVTPLSQDATAAEYLNAAEQHDLVFVCTTVAPSNVGTKLTDARAAVVTHEAELNDELGFNNAPIVQLGTDSINVVDVSHFITQPLSLGGLRILIQPRDLRYMDGSLSGGATMLANLSGSAQPIVATLEWGAMTSMSTPAAARRVFLPWASGASPSALTDEGRTLLRRALEWGAAGETAIGGNMDESGAEVGGVQNIQIAMRVTTPRDIKATAVSLYTKDPPPKKARYAVYSDDGGEPGDLIVQSGVDSGGWNSYHWRRLDLPPTFLPAGAYWVAFAFEHENMWYRYASGGQVRYRANDAVSNGFTASWGVSDQSFSRTIRLHLIGTRPDNDGYLYRAVRADQP